MIKNFFGTRTGIIAVGAMIGILAPLLQKLGNPGNMGICVACFERDIAGGLGLHRAEVVQYLRPEIIGFVLGSLAAALLFKDYRARTGSAPFARFILGVFARMGYQGHGAAAGDSDRLRPGDPVPPDRAAQYPPAFRRVRHPAPPDGASNRTSSETRGLVPGQGFWRFSHGQGSQYETDH